MLSHFLFLFIAFSPSTLLSPPVLLSHSLCSCSLSVSLFVGALENSGCDRRILGKLCCVPAGSLVIRDRGRREREREIERAARISSVVQKIKSHRPSLRGIECRNTGLSGPSPLIFVTRHRSSFRENYSTALMPREYTALNRRTSSLSLSFPSSRCAVRVCSRYQLFALAYAHGISFERDKNRRYRRIINVDLVAVIATADLGSNSESRSEYFT